MQYSVAMLAPLKRAITPDTTVSRNRVIVDLAMGLTARGHTVTLFAAGGSTLPGVRVVPVTPMPLVAMPPSENEFYQHTSYLTLEIAKALSMQGEFDVIHNHMYPEYYAFPVWFTAPLVTTVHSQMTSLTSEVLQAFPHNHLIAISHAAKKASGIPTMDVVHNSIATDFFVQNTSEKKYLLAVGRMSKAKDEKGNFLDPKGIGNAIAIAKKIGMPLKIVGNVEDPQFFETIVKPNLSDTITFIGSVSSEQNISREQMRELFAGALAFINPINWEEPFGLVMAEALSCGTPVVVFDRGAASEIVEDGRVGFVVPKERGIEGFVEALSRVSTISRDECRRHAVTYFSTERMVTDYEHVYASAISR